MRNYKFCLCVCLRMCVLRIFIEIFAGPRRAPRQVIKHTPTEDDAEQWQQCITQIEDRRERVALVSPNGQILRACDGATIPSK